MGEIRWETEVEMTNVLDVYQVTLSLEYEGNEDLGVESGERISQDVCFSPVMEQKCGFLNRARTIIRR